MAKGSLTPVRCNGQTIQHSSVATNVNYLGYCPPPRPYVGRPNKADARKLVQMDLDCFSMHLKRRVKGLHGENAL